MTERAHGVTPGLSRDYAHRSAERQAAFVRPYLQGWDAPPRCCDLTFSDSGTGECR